MRLGLLADIHGDATRLEAAIKRLRDAGVERWIVLGDVIYDHRRAAETVSLLEAIGAVGVWGNHELGLSVDPHPDLVRRFTSPVADFFAGLQARLEWEDCSFSHTLPQVDAYDPCAFYLCGDLESPESLAECFAASTTRVTFVGHYHRWRAATPEGFLPWRGDSPLLLEPLRRYLIVVDAVMNGSAAVYDHARSEVVPVSF